MNISERIAINAQNKNVKKYNTIIISTYIILFLSYALNSNYILDLFIFDIFSSIFFLEITYKILNIKYLYKNIYTYSTFILVFLFIYIANIGQREIEKEVLEEEKKIELCFLDKECRKNIYNKSLAIEHLLTTQVFRVYLNDPCIYMRTIPEIKKLNKKICQK